MPSTAYGKHQLVRYRREFLVFETRTALLNPLHIFIPINYIRSHDVHDTISDVKWQMNVGIQLSTAACKYDDMNNIISHHNTYSALRFFCLILGNNVSVRYVSNVDAHGENVSSNFTAVFIGVSIRGTYAATPLVSSAVNKIKNTHGYQYVI